VDNTGETPRATFVLQSLVADDDKANAANAFSRNRPIVLFLSDDEPNGICRVLNSCSRVAARPASS
jgi:hypothetical protein